ncbi:MAG: helix-turn-helix domain-containing protein [Caulobacteraceae bacterium]
MTSLDSDRKLFLGGRLKRLRRELGLNQTQMAQGMGVSPSYLNHLERNQRPLTARILLRLAETYDLDMRAFSGEAGAADEADLSEVFADPMFKDLAVPRHELLDLAENAPSLAEAVTRLYRAYAEARRRPSVAGEAPPVEEAQPAEWVRDYIQAHRNHFPDLDALGETLAAGLNAEVMDFDAVAAVRLFERHNIKVRVLPIEVMSHTIRRYDFHRRALLLSEQLAAASRAISLAYQLGLVEGAEALDRIIEAANPPSLQAKRLLRISLANYLAAAIRMPYAAFHQSAESLGYDIGMLKARYGVSYEQAAHRLTTLSRPGARGVPFFLIRSDSAGNVSKRFASLAFPFSRFGGACPRWNLHTVFKTPGRVVTQIIETPDGARYFTVSRTVKRTPTAYRGPDDGELALGLGCELKHASRLVYARGLDLAQPVVTEIGPTCTLCERPNCLERAAPPRSRTLTFHEWTRSASPFPFDDKT